MSICEQRNIYDKNGGDGTEWNCNVGVTFLEKYIQSSNVTVVYWSTRKTQPCSFLESSSYNSPKHIMTYAATAVCFL